MKINHLKFLLFLLIAAGFSFGKIPTASAAWWDFLNSNNSSDSNSNTNTSSSALPWWQFWASPTPSANSEQMTTDPTQLQQDRETLKNAYQSLQVDKNRILEDQQHTREAYQKLWEAKKAGQDITAAQQELDHQLAANRDDQAVLQKSIQNYQTVRHQINQDRNIYRQNAGLSPIPKSRNVYAQFHRNAAPYHGQSYAANYQKPLSEDYRNHHRHSWPQNPAR